MFGDGVGVYDIIIQMVGKDSQNDVASVSGKEG
jgi:hypothetical protein